MMWRMTGRLIGRKAHFLDGCVADSRMGGVAGRETFWRSNYRMEGGFLTACLPSSLASWASSAQTGKMGDEWEIYRQDAYSADRAPSVWVEPILTAVPIPTAPRHNMR